MTGSWQGLIAGVVRHYEKMALLLLLVLLGLSSLALLRRVEQAGRERVESERDLLALSPHTVADLDLSGWQETLQRLDTPARIERGRTGLMVSELRVSCVACGKPIGYDAERCPFCGAQQPEAVDPQKLDSSGDGIPDWWKVQYGLDPYSAHDAFIDLDGDGFTVYEEFLHGTDPTDPASHPPPAARLRLKEVVSHPFDLRFEAVQVMADGSQRFQVNLREGERSHFARMGAEVEGFTLVDYEEIIRPVEGRRVDRSVLTLRSPTGGDIRLTRGQTLTRYERSATLLFLIDGRRFENVREEDTLVLMGHTYEVVALRSDALRLKDLASEETFHVPRLSEAERAALERRAPGTRRGPGEEPFMEDIEELDYEAPRRPAPRPGARAR